ncbi:MAG: carbamoyltransferase HypF [Solirubrobacterales bacterium]
MMTGRMTASRIHITGIVQGVGFRPHVYRCAMEHGMKGWVLNSSAGVVIEAEGPAEAVDAFAASLTANKPPLAVIKTYERLDIPVFGYDAFSIRESEANQEKSVMISPDIAICGDCKREVHNPEDRRFGYAFTNCTNCGPRFTITKDVPYDRAMTTMAPFIMCPQCQEEYEDPLHRRFHAQPNACPVCGPQLTLLDAAGQVVSDNPARLLKAGKILAVKGLGGFHLACDATQEDAVQMLRRRKKRDAKPFAVMVRDQAAAEKYCRISPAELALLNAPEAPIVVLDRRFEAKLPDRLIHPGLSTLGVMFPYTPLHELLFDDALEILIMTSANLTDDPLVTDNTEAREKLTGIADYYLIHNRDIHNPCDDTVLRLVPDPDSKNRPVASGDRPAMTTQFFRRARGYVPRGIELPVTTRPILAVGGEMKNTFCLTRGNEAFLSQHFGDVNHYGNYRKFLDALPRFEAMVHVTPEVVAHDLHPDYQTTRWALQESGLPVVAVQHHHAHMASVMAEHKLTGDVLGLICDGTGYGTDGAVWGGEILAGSYRGFQRLGHLTPVALPGGNAAVERPYRMALVYLLQSLGPDGREAALNYLLDLTEEEATLVEKQIARNLNTVPTSSAGRLFDAVAAFLGIAPVSRYEGQSAIELEAVADPEAKGEYPFAVDKIDGRYRMNLLPAWPAMLRERETMIPIERIAGRFHNTLARTMVEAMRLAKAETGLNRVVLAGGTFYNRILLGKMVQTLNQEGFTVYINQNVPAGDGGLSLGQAMIANEVNEACV